MKRIVRTQPDSPVRRFAKMVVDRYTFPVVIAVIAPGSSNMIQQWNLNDFLAKVQKPEQKPPMIPGDFRRGRPHDPRDWAKRHRRMLSFSFDMDKLDHLYLKTLWKAARVQPFGKDIPKPPIIHKGKATKSQR